VLFVRRNTPADRTPVVGRTTIDAGIRRDQLAFDCARRAARFPASRNPDRSDARIAGDICPSSPTSGRIPDVASSLTVGVVIG
jgi:hypothetical protein